LILNDKKNDFQIVEFQSDEIHTEKMNYLILDKNENDGILDDYNWILDNDERILSMKVLIGSTLDIVLI
jgi:hypothetical protein